jgi:hypothetical protein
MSPAWPVTRPGLASAQAVPSASLPGAVFEPVHPAVAPPALTMATLVTYAPNVNLVPQITPNSFAY